MFAQHDFRYFVSRRRRVSTLILLSLLLVLMLVALPGPASATQPEEISFKLVMTYDIRAGDFIGRGDWFYKDSNGDFVYGGEGEESGLHTGINEDGWIRQVHTNGTLWNEDGEIMYRAQNLDFQGDWLDSTAVGNWVINGGTGAYEGLHGQGNLTGRAIFVPPQYIDVTYFFDGVAHIEP